MTEVVVVGSYNQDFIWRTQRFPVPGETRLGNFATGPGGKGFNQAVAAARQRVPTALVAALGNDPIADIAIALAKQDGIDARWERLDDHPSGSAAIVLDASGQNFIIVGSGANLALSVAHIDAQASLIGTARILLTQQEVSPEATRRAIDLARRAGTVTLHNPAPALADDDGALLDRVDILTPNETEFAHLLSRRDAFDIDPSSLAALDEDALHALCRRLGVPTVILTLGASGAFVSHSPDETHGDDRTHYRVGAETVAPVDTTGAGDAFSGALAAALCFHGEDVPLHDSVRHANRVAGLSTEAHGAAPAMPTRDAVLARFGRD
jgi:ribokinase